MSKISPNLVLQNKQAKTLNDIAKIQLKSDIINFLWGLFVGILCIPQHTYHSIPPKQVVLVPPLCIISVNSLNRDKI